MRGRLSWGLLIVAALAVALWLAARADAPGHRDLPGASSDTPREPAHPGPLKAPGLQGSAEEAAARRAAQERAAETQLASVTGRVVEDPTGDGLPGVNLLCAHWHEERDLRRATHYAVSGTDGAFTVQGLAPGRWLLVPFHPLWMHPLTGSFFGDPLGAGRRLRSANDTWEAARTQGLAFEVAAGGTERPPIEVRMGRGPLVAGRVVDGAGAPVVGAGIRVEYGYYGPLTEVQVDTEDVRAFALVRTNTDGRFALRCFAADTPGLRLGAVRAGLVGRWTDALDLDAAASIEIVLQQPATLEGVVRWSDGRPAAEARVGVSDFEDWLADPDWVDTDDQGRFRIPGVPPAEVTVQAWAAGDRPERAEVVMRALRPGELRGDLVLPLNDQHFLQGVLRGPDGTPLAHEYVVAYAQGAGPDDESIESDWTDDAGRFAVEIETPEAVELRLETADRHVVLSRDLRAPREGLALVAEPTPRATIAVRVLDPEGRPVPRFDLALGLEGGVLGRFRHQAGGVASAVVQGAPPYVVFVTHPRDAEGRDLPYAPYGLELLEAPSEAIEMRLSPQAEFLGRVTDQHDAPVPGVRLFAAGREIPLQEDGRFRFRSEDPAVRRIGDVRLVLPPGFRRPEYADVLEAGEYRAFEVTGGGLAVRGRVQVAEGAAPGLGGITIEATWPPGEDEDEWDARSSTKTEADGRFVLPALPEGREITITAEAADLAGHGLYADGPPVTVPSGASDVVLRARAGASIAGRLEGPGLADLDWEHVAVRVMLWIGYGDRSLQTEQPTRAAPTFRISGLRPGRYDVAVVTEGEPYRVLAAEADVAAGRSDVVLRVPRQDGVITGTVEMAGLATKELVVLVWHQDATRHSRTVPVEKDGRFRVEGLPQETRFSLELVVAPNEDGLVAVAADVAPGTEVRLVAKPGAWIGGRVVGGPESKVGFVLAHGPWTFAIAACDEETGAFRVGPLAPGSYRLVARRGNEVAAELEGVAAGRKDVELVVR